jgi:hypothetical protein
VRQRGYTLVTIERAYFGSAAPVRSTSCGILYVASIYLTLVAVIFPKALHVLVVIPAVATRDTVVVDAS